MTDEDLHCDQTADVCRIHPKRTALQMCRITAGFNSDSCDKTGEPRERDQKGVNDDLMTPQQQICLMVLKTSC